jgi:NAD(P)-dependent dehydrogenase (short-subunit alcohol dehydrogenase family)
MTSQRAQVFVVTGASSGIGFATAELLVRGGASIIMVSKDRARGERAFQRLRRIGTGQVDLALGDLGVMSAVRELAERIRTRVDHIDALINNAGVLSARRTITSDGFETTMAVNHLAPFLLSHLLVDRLSTTRGRIVTVSSNGHGSTDLRRAPLDDILRGRAWAGMMKAYSDSKLANILFTFEWARRMQASGVIANTLHPGVLRTRVWNQNLHPLSLFMQPFKLFMGSPKHGAIAIVQLALPGVADDGGKYFEQLKPARAAEQAYDAGLAAELWDASEGATGLHGRDGAVGER